MKVLYEPGEIDSIEEATEVLREHGQGCLFEENNPDKLYGLTFKVKPRSGAVYLSRPAKRSSRRFRFGD